MLRRGAAVLVAAGLVPALAGCLSTGEEITISRHGSAVTIGYAQVAEDWLLVVGGEPDDDLGAGQWQVLTDVEVTNVGDETREMHLEFAFSNKGRHVMTATCVSAAEDVAPGSTVPLGCAGTKQVTPNDFDSITVRALR